MLRVTLSLSLCLSIDSAVPSPFLYLEISLSSIEDLQVLTSHRCFSVIYMVHQLSVRTTNCARNLSCITMFALCAQVNVREIEHFDVVCSLTFLGLPRVRIGKRDSFNQFCNQHSFVCCLLQEIALRLVLRGGS